MNKTSIVFICALLGCPAMAEDINESLDADANGTVKISNTAGSVDVTGWSKKTVEVTGTLGDDVDELIFERNDDKITIKVKAQSSSGMWGRKDISSELSVRVPQGSSVEIATISAEIDVEGVHGEQELQAISGDIETEMFGQDIQVESVSGDIDIVGDNKDAESEIGSVSGDVTVQRLAGEMSAGSVSGNVIVDEGSFARANIETVSGDIVYEAALRAGGRLDVETVNGEVRVVFVGDVSARFDIETFNGDVDNCFGPQAERTSRYAPGLELSFTEGDGAGRVSMSTLNGDVYLCKK